MWVVDAGLIIILGIGLAILSDMLLGDEDALNLVDDTASFSENTIDSLLKVWKSTVGEVHSTLYNIFTESMKASPALAKLVAATATIGLSLSLMDIFAGEVQKLHGTCVADFFGFFNTPINFIKSTLYDFYAPLGYLSDIFFMPFETVVALISLVAVALWNLIKKTKTGGFLCGLITSNVTPCCPGG